MNEEKILAIEAIKKKLRGRSINYEECFAIMNQFSRKELGDIFIAYFAAAGFKEGFNDDELYFLTKAMVETGKKLHFSGLVADKHSIGGMPGTRTSLIVVPIIAAAGFLIPKTSSRAITTPAGTSDCMEVLANVDFSVEEVENMVNKVGGCVVWNDKLGLAPADDIIIRVEEPLMFESFEKIMISILAKKVAAGSKIMILDVPVGPTMKIKYVKDALKFADKFSELATRFDLQVKTEVNYQLEPAGEGIGPALEVIDVLKVLDQTTDRSHPLEDKSIKIASRLLDMCLLATNRKDDGLLLAESILKSGKAASKFREIIKAQKGDPTVTADKISLAPFKAVIKAEQFGKVSLINNYNISSICRILGAPKSKRAGMRIKQRINQKVDKGDILLELYSEDQQKIDEAVNTLSRLPIFQFIS